MNSILHWMNKNKYLTAAIGVAVVMFITICVLLATSDTVTQYSIEDNKYARTENNSEKELKNHTDDFDSSEETEENSSTEKESPTVPDSTEGNQDATSSDEPSSETQKETPPPELPYLIKVNRALNCITIYGKDKKGNYTEPYIAFACSTGKIADDTPLGTFTTSDKYVWCRMVDSTYGQYAYRIDGPIMFHSVPSYVMSKDSLETEQYNLLGQAASLGCIRLNVRDAKWLYDNCPSGTTVIIYDDTSSPGPLGKPKSIHLPTGHAYSGWDPLDPDPANPWNNAVPSISGAKDRTVTKGTEIDLLKSVKAKDSCLNDITSFIKVEGTVNTGKTGSYPVTYSVTDLLGRTASKTITITVIKSKKQTSTEEETDKETPTETEKETKKKPPKETEKETPKETEKETKKKPPKETEKTTPKESNSSKETAEAPKNTETGK